MSESVYIPLKVTKDEGAYIYYSGAYNSATGATGAQGWLRTEALYGNWDSVRFLNVVGSGVSTFPSANPTSANLYIATGTAFTGIGDVRGEATGLAHLPSGWLDPVNGTGALLAKNTTYDAGLYAVYQGDNTYTGMVTVDATGTANGWLSGEFTTREIYEFETDFSLDTGDLSTSGVGSGVYKGAEDVTLQYEIINKLGNALNTTSEIADDPFISGINVSILDITGRVVFANYRSEWLSPSFNFTRQDNLDVFGAYTKDFGVRYEVVNTDGGSHTSDFYCYANGLTFDKVYVEAASGAVLNESSTGNYFPPDTGGLTTTEAEDAVRYFNGQTVSPSGRTGSIAMTVYFNEDPTYTQYDSISLFSKTGTPNFTPNEGNFVGDFALEQIQAQQIVLFQEDGLDLDVDIYFLMILNSSVTHNTTNITIGPYYLTKQPEGENPFIFNVGNQTIDGNLEVDYLTGKCLTVGPPGYDYPYTIYTRDGHVGIGTSTALVGGAKMSVNGNLVGGGTAGRATGPGGVDYALSTDVPADDDTLQSVTDRGKTTTNDISVGTSVTPTAPLTIKTDSSDDAGVDIYADGDTSNRILTLKADSNNAGEIIVKDTAGVDSVKLSNTSSKGQADFYDAGGTGRMTLVVDGNNQGKLTLKDSAANTSIELSSDSDKRGNLGVYDAAGTLKAEIKADSNDEGIMSIKDKVGAVSTIIQGHKAIMAAFDSNIYSTGSVIVAGSGHVISGDYDIIAGGATAIISGGNFNFIGGGSGVDITGSAYSSSIGGYNNDIQKASQSVIGGGYSNLIKDSESAALFGGVSNTITGNGWGFIGGGEENIVSGSHASILGGEVNRAYGYQSSVAGGGGNEVHGRYAFVGGGEYNIVSGNHSFGLGRNARVAYAHSGAGVLADGQNRNHSSSGEHTLTLDFASGVYVPTIGYFAEGLHVSGVPVLTGENNPAEADTLQTVTTRGNTTTTSILSTGPHISGVTGLYSDKVGIGTGIPTYPLEIVATTDNQDLIRLSHPSSPHDAGFMIGFTNDGAGNNNNATLGVEYGGSDYDVINIQRSTRHVGIGEADPAELLGVAPDTDVSAEIGRAHIGNVGFSDYAGFSHVDKNSAGNFALLQAADGTTFVNCSSNEEIRFQANNYTLGGFNGANGDFNIATDAFYVDASEHSIGVGTSAPTQELDVRGTSLLSGQVIIDGGVGVASSATLHLRQKGDTKTDGIALTSSNSTSHRIWKDSAGTFNIGPSTFTDAFVQDLDGHVGIGASSPRFPLEVSGTGLFSGVHVGKTGHYSHVPTELLAVSPGDDVSAEIGQAHIGYMGHSNYAGFSHIDQNTTTNYAFLQQSNGATYVNAKAATNIYFKMGGTTYGGFNSSNDFYIDTDTLYVDVSEDRVGVGTSSPSYTLEVTESDASSLLSRFYNSSTTNGQGILVRAGETSNENRILQLASRDDTKVMTVNSNGRVGIGTDTTPTYKLDVGGGTSSTSNTLRINQNDGGTAIRMGAGGGSSDVVMLRIDGSSTAGEHDGETDKSKYGFSLNYMGSRSSNANSLSLFSDDGAATNQVEALTVTQSGQLGILDTSITGYASDDLALAVGGPMQVDGAVTSVTALTDVTSTSYTFVAGDQSNTVSFNNASAMTGLIPPNSSVPFPIGTEIALFQKGAGQVHITTGSNAVTINAADAETKTRVQYSSAMCLKTGTDGWLVVGDLTS